MTWVLREPIGGQRGRCKGDVRGREIRVGHEGCVGVCQAESGGKKDLTSGKHEASSRNGGMVRSVWESNC